VSTPAPPTGEAPPEETSPAGHPPNDPTGRPSRDARAAVAAARARTRRAWRFQLIGALVVLLVLGLIVGRVWQTSEIRAVRLHTATVSAQPLPSGAPAAAVKQAWQTDAVTASGSPVFDDVVVTSSGRSVIGRSVIDGSQRWSYTRTDRQLCTVVGASGLAIAIYAHDGLCDEVTALDIDTGQREWVRTFTLTASPAELRVASDDTHLLVVAPDAVELIGVSSGIDFWLNSQPTGCRTKSAVLGDNGVLIASSCSSGDTLQLRRPGDKDNAVWSKPLDGRTPLTADRIAMALEPDGRIIDVLNQQNGNVSSNIRLTDQVTPSGQIASFAPSLSAAVYVIQVGSSTIAIQATGAGALAWQQSGLTVGIDRSELDLLYAATSGQINQIDPETGITTAKIGAPGVVAADRVLRLGARLLVSGPTATAVYA
jgi:hypothetical protein